MIDSDILYLKRSNRATVIYLKHNVIKEVNQTIEVILNQYCLKDLTTLEGRIKAISEVYHIKKQIPIYISKQLILIQTANKKEIDNLYINSYNIIDIVKEHNHTIIYFNDSSKIELKKPSHLIQRYYDLSMKIKNKLSF